MLITPLTETPADAFFLYLTDHLVENGSESTGYYHPQPRGVHGFPADKAISFRRGLSIALREPGWRRAWLAGDGEHSIMGHVDLRARPEPNTSHRCLLGLGVHRDHRKRGVGRALLEYAKAWAIAEQFEWMDLQVFATNANAIQLYRKAGFVQTGETPDLFRLDGHSIGDISMSLALR